MLDHHIINNLFRAWNSLKRKRTSRRPLGAMAISADELSAVKQSELEVLCHKLLQRQELVVSGRLQLLGLGKIKQRMGRRWPGMQKIIYEVCDETIKKFLSAGDVFIRYKDDNYMLLFANSSEEEIEIKVMLIAGEIKRQLFDYDEFEGLEISNQVAHLSAKSMQSNALPFPESIHHAFKCSPPQKQQDSIFDDSGDEPDLSKIKSTDVAAFADEGRRIGDLDLGVDEHAAGSVDVQYMPVWDQYKKRLISFLCLAVHPQYPDIDPVKGYQMLCTNLSDIQRGALDMSVLGNVLLWMGKNKDDVLNFGIICPVHYRTLARMDTAGGYKKICQQIDPSMKQNMLFMVLDVPSAPWLSLSQVVSPLKTYGRVLCGQVSMKDHIDFESLRMSGFDHLGVILEVLPSDEGLKKAVGNVGGFVTRARKHLIYNTFVLGVNDLLSAASVARSGVRFMAGSAVYECLREPQGHLDFYKNRDFKEWQNVACQVKRGRV